MTTTVLLLLLATTLVNSNSHDDYYSSLPDLTSPSSGEEDTTATGLLNLINDHVVVSYADCWAALADVDVDSSNVNNVLLLYSLKSVDKTIHGTSDTWNREHVWPKSYGVGYSGPDYSDLHSLRPADWSVNSARSNRAFDSCDAALSSCEMPAHAEAAPDTAKYPGFFQPPSERRGDVARSMFYMALRYGSDTGEANTEVLTLSDCPCQSRNEMGKLSVLLDWNEEDPVDEREMERNDKIAATYQLNRNPFVDFPNLARYFFESQPVCSLWRSLGPHPLQARLL